MNSKTPPGQGACDHTQPSEVARLGEEWLKSRGIPEHLWDGCRFGYGGTGGSGPWASVYTEVERRGIAWMVVKLDRRKDPLPPNMEGLRAVRVPDSAGTGTGTGGGDFPQASG
ncbi:MAG TPA: hypothetical protein VK465_00315 [Fibrobacteria bacterium]|nr:hypothetical protein [Fibrobacteria bacterium]